MHESVYNNQLLVIPQHQFQLLPPALHVHTVSLPFLPVTVACNSSLPWLQYPVKRYVGIQDCHIRDWQPARQPAIPSSDAEGSRELTCIYFSKESSTLAKVLKVYKLVATVPRTQYRNTVFHRDYQSHSFWWQTVSARLTSLNWPVSSASTDTSGS